MAGLFLRASPEQRGGGGRRGPIAVVEGFGDSGAGLGGLQFEAPVLRFEVTPGDQAVLLELHDPVAHPVRNTPQPHRHDEFRPEAQAVGPVKAAPKHVRTVDFDVPPRIGEDVEDPGRRCGDLDRRGHHRMADDGAP